MQSFQKTILRFEKLANGWYPGVSCTVSKLASMACCNDWSSSSFSEVGYIKNKIASQQYEKALNDIRSLAFSVCSIKRNCCHLKLPTCREHNELRAVISRCLKVLHDLFGLYPSCSRVNVFVFVPFPRRNPVFISFALKRLMTS